MKYFVKQSDLIRSEDSIEKDSDIFVASEGLADAAFSADDVAHILLLQKERNCRISFFEAKTPEEAIFFLGTEIGKSGEDGKYGIITQDASKVPSFLSERPDVSVITISEGKPKKKAAKKAVKKTEQKTAEKAEDRPEKKAETEEHTLPADFMNVEDLPFSEEELFAKPETVKIKTVEPAATELTEDLSDLDEDEKKLYDLTHLTTGEADFSGTTKQLLHTILQWSVNCVGNADLFAKSLKRIGVYDRCSAHLEEIMKIAAA